MSDRQNLEGLTKIINKNNEQMKNLEEELLSQKQIIDVFTEKEKILRQQILDQERDFNEALNQVCLRHLCICVLKLMSNFYRKPATYIISKTFLKKKVP